MDAGKEESKITLVSKDGDRIKFLAKMSSLCELIGQSQLDEEIPVREISTEVLNLILRFCEAHAYDDSTMTWVFPITSSEVSAHVDSISFQVLLKDYEVLAKTSNHTERVKQLGLVLDAAFYLGFNKLKKIVNVALQVPFFCGTEPDDIKEFMEKWHIDPDELTKTSLQNTIQNFKPIHSAYLARPNLLPILKAYKQAKNK